MKKRNKLFWGVVIGLTGILTSCQQQETTQPVRKNLEDAVFASGYVENENNYTVSSKVEGIIVTLSVKEGDIVSTGELVATIENDIQSNQLQDAVVVYEDAVNNASDDSPQLQNLQTQILQAQQQLQFDEENYSRYQGLWEKKSVSRLDFEKAELQYQLSQKNLETLQENYREVERALRLNVDRSVVQVSTQETLLKDYRLATEEAGTVINVYKNRGELIRKGEALARIGSGDYVVKLLVAEDDITQIDLGQSVAININTYPNEVFSATITKIYPGFDEGEQSYLVEAKFDDLPEKMFSGTQLQANIKTGRREDVLMVPTDFLIRGSYVLLASGEEKEIETGSKSGTWTEIVSGLSEGDIIVKSIN